MTTHTPEASMLTFLSTQNVDVFFDAYSATGNAFVVELPDSPDVAVAAARYGAVPVQAGHAQGYDEPTIQLRVRGVRGDRLGPAQWAKRIYDVLQGVSSMTWDDGGPFELRVIRCEAVQSAPYSIGRDGNDRFEEVINVAVQHRTVVTLRE